MTAVPMAPQPPPSFELFYRDFSGDALRYARAIIGPEGAEDACQEAWLRAWRAWGTAEPGKEQPWLSSARVMGPPFRQWHGTTCPGCQRWWC